MAARKKLCCSECGAELRLGPARCPLCGAPASPGADASPPPDPEAYQTKVRELREQLSELRDEGAEAV